jgi:ribosomal protein L9
MMRITLNGSRRRAFLFGRQAALRATNDLVDQLQEQLNKEREQHRFNVSEMQKEIAILIRDLMEARYQLARRDVVDAFRDTPSPSALKH